MTLRNKKLLNMLVAAFVVVVMAGSAFAFVSQGPLAFTGTATVDASLELAIMSGQIHHHGYPHMRPGGASFVGGYHDTWTGPARAVSFITDFDAPGQSVSFNFVVENRGTIPAVINYVDITTNVGPGHPLYGLVGANEYPISILLHMWEMDGVNWNEMQGAANVVLEPGETVGVQANVRFLTDMDASQLEALNIGHELVGEFVTTLELEYGVYVR